MTPFITLSELIERVTDEIVYRKMLEDASKPGVWVIVVEVKPKKGRKKGKK